MKWLNPTQALTRNMKLTFAGISNKNLTTVLGTVVCQ